MELESVLTPLKLYKTQLTYSSGFYFVGNHIRLHTTHELSGKILRKGLQFVIVKINQIFDQLFFEKYRWRIPQTCQNCLFSIILFQAQNKNFKSDDLHETFYFEELNDSQHLSLFVTHFLIPLLCKSAVKQGDLARFPYVRQSSLILCLRVRALAVNGVAIKRPWFNHFIVIKGKFSR